MRSTRKIHANKRAAIARTLQKFGDKMSLADVAKRHGVSSPTVSRIKGAMSVSGSKVRAKATEGDYWVITKSAYSGDDPVAVYASSKEEAVTRANRYMGTDISVVGICRALPIKMTLELA